VTKTIMIVEDELLVALDVQDIVEDVGLAVDGPYETVSSTLAALDGMLPDCAILDVRLLDNEVFPAADRLRDEGIPLIFHSAHADEAQLKTRYPAAQICAKPSSPSELRRALHRAVGGEIG
jgi:CheY-like chemotaxis protein